MNIVQVFVLVAWSCGVSAVVDGGSSSDAGDGNTTAEICPVFWSRVRESRIAEYGTNCTRYLLAASSKKHELFIHQKICLAVHSALYGMCKAVGGGDETNLFQCLSSPPKARPQCPIRMSPSDGREDFDSVYRDLSRFLENRTNCEKICYDVDDFVEQCRALIIVRECLNSFGASISNATEALMERTGQKVSQFEETNADAPRRGEPSPDLLSNGEPGTGEEQGPGGGGKKDAGHGLVSSERQGPGADVGRDASSEQRSPGQVTPPPPSSPVPPIKGAVRPQGLDNPSERVKFPETPKPGFDSPLENSRVKEDADENPDEVFANKHRFPSSLDQSKIYSGEGYFQAEESHFFFYFLMFSSIVIIVYFAFHNKNKILAYALEGRSERRSGRRRSNPVKYRRLETNLEEVIASSVTPASASGVVY